MVTLTNVGTSYDAVAASRGLGGQLVDLTGVTSIRLLVSVSRVGSGTQSWQLWNETDGTELGVITDAVAGEKKLDATFILSPVVGVKLLRIRAKSTTASDDPIFFFATLLVKFG